MDEYEIWLYGSTARGDADELSDVDVLVAGEAPSSVVGEYRKAFGRRLSLSRYAWDELHKMTRYGSLFLLHVRMEGRLLKQSTTHGGLRLLLEDLPPYAYAKRDLASFRQTLSDIEASLEVDSSPQFEMAVLATVIRHSSVLGCYAIGQPTFGRYRPVDTFVTAVGLDPRIACELRSLYAFRMFYARGIKPANTLPRADVHRWVEFGEAYLSLVEDKVDGFCSPVS